MPKHINYPKHRKSYKPTKEHLQKISVANSIALKKLWQYPEYREKMLSKNTLVNRLVRQDGENNPSWKGGITSKNKLLRVKFYREIRPLVLERDNYTCQICGSGENLQVDHVQSWEDYIELRFSINNCRTLCVRCHYKLTYGRELPDDIKHWGAEIYSYKEKGGI